MDNVLEQKEFQTMNDKLRNKNRFLLGFPEDCGIFEWYVKSIQKPRIRFINGGGYIVNRNLIVKLSGFCGDKEFIDICDKFNNANYDFITFTDLDRTGCAFETEQYWKPMITEVTFGESDYSNDEYKEFIIQISFDRVDVKYKDE